MPGRFTDAELETLSIDPREPAARAPCPWCGMDLILGVRKSTRNITLAHAGHADPTDPTHTRFISGCESFMAALGHDDVFKRLYNAGARFQKLVPG